MCTLFKLFHADAGHFFNGRWCDAKLSSFPASFINFITRTVIGEVWSKLLDVAQEVRLGKRPNHEKAIKGQPEIYQFIRERIDTMISKIVQEKPSMEDFRLISHLLS